MAPNRRLLIALLVPGLFACEGTLLDGPLGPTGAPPRRSRPPDPVCTTSAPGAAPLRRITEDQWLATIEALFGEGAADGVPFPGAVYRRGYRTYADLGEVSRDGAVALAEAASTIAERVVTADVAATMGCTPANDACVSGWIDTLGERAFRRPLRPDERALLLSLYVDLRDVELLTEREAAIGVVEAVLASPQLNYIASDVMNDDGTVLRHDDHAIAERLSFFLWNEPPDDTLRTAARESRLHAREDVEREARRMILDARTARMLGGFVEDWLELHRVRGMSKDRAAHPEWSAGLSGSVAEEHFAFVDEVMQRGDARLSTLLAADIAVVDPELASLYGTTTTSGRAQLGTERRGLLNMSGFLAGHAGSTESAPVLRGVTVIRQLLCEDMELPVGLAVTSPPLDPTLTTRERFTVHRADAYCATCHDRIDPIGFALEDFDAIGAHREIDQNGLPIDATGRLSDLEGTLDVPVNGGAELAIALASSPVVRSCFAQQVLSYAEARVLASEGAGAELDGCAISQLADRFARADGDVRELLVAIVTSDAFLTRRTN